MRTDPNELGYFDVLYHNNDDPWGYEKRWYEARKRQICLSLLMKEQYQHGLEIGCSNGVFSQQLAERCQRLTCLDANAQAIQLAQKKLGHLTHVDLQQHCIPHQFPEQKYDLIVISEILYYLSEAELRQCMAQVQQALTSDGVVLCCHWRYPIEGFELNGETVHEILKSELTLHHYLACHDPDFMIDLWSVQSESLAQHEGLI